MNNYTDNTIPHNDNVRNYGIDALRIYSMFLVVILHIMGDGGLLDASEGVNNKLAYLIETMAFCAVDIYALISGYTGYSDKKKNFKSSKFISIWVEVFCYSFGITLLAFIFCNNTIGVVDLIQAALPVASNYYWYFSCYVLLLLLTPWINSLLRTLDKREMYKLVAAIITATSLYMVFVEKLGAADPFKLNHGYSSLWLIILYVLGAWMKKCEILNIVSKKVALIAIIVCIVVTYGARFLPGLLSLECLLEYTSPTIVIMAMGYLILFGRLKLNNTIVKLVTIFSPAAFGVYLIHTHPIIRKLFITDGFIWISDSPAMIMFLQVIGCALLILVSCLLIEKVRLIVFKLLRIDNLIAFVGKKADEFLAVIFNKVR